MKAVFFDAYNLIHRARHSTPAYLRNSRHGITYTFFRSFAALYRRMEPDQAFFVIEGIPRRRLALHPEYKAGRAKGPDDGFDQQKNEIIDLVAAGFPLHVVQHPDFECDDIIAHLVGDFPHATECVVVSTDTDFLQLANTAPNFVQYDPIRKKYKDLPQFDYVRWKALRGDSSDNIPGFKGIGDKRALKLLGDEGDLAAFLSEGDNRSRFEKNIELIAFHDVSKELDGITFSSGCSDWEHIKDNFTAKSFTTIVKENSWQKFVNSFGENYGAPQT